MHNTSSPSPTEVSLATRYLTLSSEYTNRPVVARRNTLPTLLKFLGSDNHVVKKIAAQTILNLAQHPENPAFLCQEKTFVSCLFEAYKESEACDPELFEITTNIFECLRTVLSAQEAQPNAPMSDGQSSRIAKSRNVRILNSTTREKNTCRTLDLSLDVMGVTGRAELEDLFQTTRGVVSYSIDTSAKTVSLYLTTPTSTLLNILAGSGFHAQVVSEINHPPNKSETPEIKEQRPSYLPAYLSAANSTFSQYRQSLVVRSEGGSEDNTLAGRIKKQKLEDSKNRSHKDKHSISSFMSKITAGWW